MKLYLDPGHGGEDAGASGNGLKEKDITLSIAKHIRSILTNDYKNVTVKMSRSGDKTVSLSQRTNEANNWGADYFLSIHCNSFNGTARGFEDYIYSSLSDAAKTASYQHKLHKAILRQNQLKDRASKKENLHVLRESSMPALLTENGFIDHKQDAKLMKDNSWRNQVAQGHVNGLEHAFDLKRKSSGTQSIYHVIAGSFQKKTNAESRRDLLKKEDINANIDTFSKSDEQWYRVQANAGKNQKNAATRLRKVKRAGVKDAYLVKKDE